MSEECRYLVQVSRQIKLTEKCKKAFVAVLLKFIDLTALSCFNSS